MCMNIPAVAVCAADGPCYNSEQHKINSVATSMTNLQHCEAEDSGSFFFCVVMALRCRCTITYWMWRWNPLYRSIPHCIQRRTLDNCELGEGDGDSHLGQSLDHFCWFHAAGSDRYCSFMSGDICSTFRKLWSAHPRCAVTARLHTADTTTSLLDTWHWECSPSPYSPSWPCHTFTCLAC